MCKPGYMRCIIWTHLGALCDVEQREGRILRQGSTCEEVEIFRYVTEGSFRCLHVADPGNESALHCPGDERRPGHSVAGRCGIGGIILC